MNNWNRLLHLLDMTVGFPNKVRSSVKKKWQGYDQQSNEHVIWIEYRIRVKPGYTPRAKQPKKVEMPPQKGSGKMKWVRPYGYGGPLALIRELLD